MALFGASKLHVSNFDASVCAARRLLRRIEEANLPMPSVRFHNVTRIYVAREIYVTMFWGPFSAHVGTDSVTGDTVIACGPLAMATVDGAVERLAQQCVTTHLN